jgi:hypothetical protein
MLTDFVQNKTALLTENIGFIPFNRLTTGLQVTPYPRIEIRVTGIYRLKPELQLNAPMRISEILLHVMFNARRQGICVTACFERAWQCIGDLNARLTALP